ncbi:SDR family oxidoreductase [Cellulophaga baltica]|uniref:SDR family oxidoreductase n=1 Tax=Cellulophaga TaxID=104264 RepID=UPI001C07C15D|nr:MULTISPECIES: SDR family oxidoreductase [Cellulophaga]MBU2997178.1 SDR family oxidoreductase [Cellulophaga baltica]MDO6768576.1 SDR family oxidoreductase [Cellulophaga sp. 1_MG-2023]
MIKPLNKVIIVTGASRGIGREMALLLAENNAEVVVNFASSEKEAKETVDLIKSKNGNAIAVKADVSKKDEVAMLFDETIHQFGRVDVLVNNAGVMDMKELSESSEDDFDKVYNIHAKGVYHTMKEAYSKLSDGGNIINVSSSTVKMMLPGYSLYSSSKAAVEQMTRVFSKEVGRNISVNAIAPGPVDTELFTKGKSEEFIDKLKSMSAFNRIGEPSDIANVILFLASDESKWISGQILPVNGAIV